MDEAIGYTFLPNDPRIVNQYAATDAIATSSGQNDSGGTGSLTVVLKEDPSRPGFQTETFTV